MKIYKRRSGFMYYFLLVSIYILPVAIAVVYFTTGKFAFQALPGMLIAVGAIIQMKANQHYIKLDDNTLIIVNLRYNNEQIPFALNYIDEITLIRSLSMGYKISIRCNQLIETYSVALNSNLAFELKQELEARGLKVVA